LGLLSVLREKLRKRKLAGREPADVFRGYFQRNKWGDAESRSGKGSNLAATATLRRLLPATLRDLGVRSVLDLPCGDFHWMSQVDLPGIDYLGGDIVPEMIAENLARHERNGVSFEVIDLISGPVPRADLIFCRDCLVHLSFAHACAALDNIRDSGSEWLLTTTFPGIAANADISTGQWRKIDLTLPPFSLPPPVRLVEEGEGHLKGQKPDKMLGLWRIVDLRPANVQDVRS
jgi:SAM-dependent methyltransferase